MTASTSRVLIEACDVVMTMDDVGTELPGGSLLIEQGVVTWIGRERPTQRDGAEVVDGRGCVAIPGLINTHHHLYQSLTRVRAQTDGLFGWLRSLYPVWAHLDAAWVRVASRVALTELALSGCSTTTDHHYVFPAGSTGIFEAEIEAAREIGLRFHPCRGSMDLGQSQGGLPPDRIVEDTDDALAGTEAAVRHFHDPSHGSMLQVAVAPCSPFSVSRRLMEASQALARRLGVRLHTHIAETLDEEAYCRETFGRRPMELLEDLGWLGSDVWLAHCVHVNGDDIRRIAASGTSVAWCPTSNLRLGSGIAPARELLDAGAAVGLAVDGSASNDSGHLLAEARQAMLIARAHGGPGAMTAREALRIATRGGARCLGRDDIGSLEPGKRGDVALFDITGVTHVGAEADLIASLVSCQPQRVKHLLVEGRWVVRDGKLVTADEGEIAREGRRIARMVATDESLRAQP